MTPTPSVGILSAWNYSDRALEEIEKGNLKGAITDYTEAIRLEPNAAGWFEARGSLYGNHLKQYSKAISDYTESIKLLLLKPDDYFALCHRGGLYSSRGLAYFSLKEYHKGISDYSKAVSDYTEAIRLEPNLSSAYWERGNAYYYGLKQYSKAVSDYTETIRLWSSNAMFNVALIYESRASAYDKLGKSSLAAQDRKKAQELRGR
jgi:tetratricopeptide (TPR) repeat protein